MALRTLYGKRRLFLRREGGREGGREGKGK